MIFRSAIAFNENDAVVLNIVKNYFAEAKDSVEDSSTFDQMNFRIFILCAYVGLTIVDGNDTNLFTIEESDKDDSKIKFNVPVTILAQNVSRMKELLICANFVNNNYVSTDENLQLIWNMESYSDNSELTNFIKEKTVVGARYIAGLTNDNVRNVASIARNIGKKLDEYTEHIDIEMTALEVEADIAEYEV